jgi:hypothetical protein
VPSHPVPKIANREFGESIADLEICILCSPSGANKSQLTDERDNVAYDRLLASQQITHMGTRGWVSNHWQTVCYRMIDSVCRLDAQRADATPPWNTLYYYWFLFLFIILNCYSLSKTEQIMNHSHHE